MPKKGLERVTFEPFNKSSVKIFHKITSTFPSGWKVTHVGSTAIGIPGKNIIDILIETKNTLKTKQFFLKRKWCLIIPRKKRKTILLKRKFGPKEIIHVHIAKHKSKDAKLLLFFVSYLKRNKSSREKYTKLKKEAVKLGKVENNEYNKHKHEFIQSILKKSKA